MNKIERWAVLLLLSCCLVLQTGCKKKAADHPAEANAESFQITITQSGGFTGGIEGYIIASDGKIERFQQMPGRGKNVVFSAIAKADQVHDYRNWFENSGLLQEELNEKGNMTTTVRYETADTSYVWSFPTGAAPGSPIAKKLNDWCSEVTNSFKNKK